LQHILPKEFRVILKTDKPQRAAGDRNRPKGRADQRGRGKEHAPADQHEARPEPEERLPPGRSPRTARTAHRQRPPAAAAFCWSRSRTCLGFPPGCTASPIVCCTSSFTLSHAGSVVGASFADGRASRYGLSPGSDRICSRLDVVTGRKPSARIQRVMVSG